MDIGFFSYNSDFGVRPETLAKELEARDFDSLWVGEHTHIPASRKTPFPGGIDLPRPYYHFRDPFVSLTMAAAVTKKLNSFSKSKRLNTFSMALPTVGKISFSTLIERDKRLER